MDIEILLALQNFRNGGGAFLTSWVSERRFVGFSTDVPMTTRVSRAAEGLLSYYIVSLIFVPLIKTGFRVPPGQSHPVLCRSCMCLLSFHGA